MKALVIALALVTAAGCASKPQGVRVNWIKATTPLELEGLCFRAGARSPEAQVLGCQFWSGSTCTVIVMAEDEVVLGHEVRHCFDGRFHGRGPTHG